MDKENEIIIKENGKVINKRSKPIMNSTKSEVAATLHESDESLQVVEDKPKIREVPLNKAKKKSLFKPMFLAVSSAIIIGAVLSVVMFQFLLDVENNGGGEGLSRLPAFGQADNNSDNGTNANENSESGSFSLEPLQGYALQAGLFSEPGNAEKWAQNISDIGLPNMIWEQSDQYYILIGIAETKEQATSLANSLSTGDIELYVKEWTTTEGEIQVTESEQEWLQTFHKLWNENLSNAENLTLDNWQELQTDQVNESERLAPFLQHISEQSSNGEIAGQHKLLQLMYEYEKINRETGN